MPNEKVIVIDDFTPAQGYSGVNRDDYANAK